MLDLALSLGLRIRNAFFGGGTPGPSGDTLTTEDADTLTTEAGDPLTTE